MTCINKQKTSRPQMGREALMRPAVPPKLITNVIHFTPTNIGLSNNVEITVRTTNVTPDTFSRKRLGRELQLVSDECNFQRLRCKSLAASASLLSSVTAFDYCNYLRKRRDVKAWKKLEWVFSRSKMGP